MRVLKSVGCTCARLEKMMACEASFPLLTPSSKPHEAHHAAQCRNTCSFPARLKLSRVSPSRPTSIWASKNKSAGLGKKTKKKVEDDPWETLFKQLEKDLENDSEDTSEKEITEADLANFERELDMVVEELTNLSNTGTMSELEDMLRGQSKETVKDGGESDSDSKEDFKAMSVDEHKGVDDHNEDKDDDRRTEFDDEYLSDDEFEEPRKVSLQPWQLRKLAAAVELGRRKVQVKSLAAELQLDRDDVLFFLKNPPPELLIAASQLEEEKSKDDESVSDEEDTSSDEGETLDDSILLKDANADQAKDDGQSHELERRTYGRRVWAKGKRIKKMNLATLQRVYKKTKWPSNTLIESVVRATNLPRVRVLKWFEEERARFGEKEPPRLAGSRKAWKRPVTHSFERL